MKIAIITAMQEEANHIINKYKLTLSKELSNLKIYENENIVLGLSWIWKIQSSFATSYIILNYQVKNIVNIWIAWSLMFDKSKIWDVFIVNKISQHDMYLPFDWEHLNYAKKEILINTDLNIDFSDLNFEVTKNSYCLTWDQFIDDEAKVRELALKYNANVIEMEAFAIWSVARELNMLDNLIIIKAISDWADNDAKSAHMWNLDFAMNNSILVLEKIIKTLI